MRATVLAGITWVWVAACSAGASISPGADVRPDVDVTGTTSGTTSVAPTSTAGGECLVDPSPPDLVFVLADYDLCEPYVEVSRQMCDGVPYDVVVDWSGYGDTVWFAADSGAAVGSMHCSDVSGYTPCGNDGSSCEVYGFAPQGCVVEFRYTCAAPPDTGTTGSTGGGTTAGAPTGSATGGGPGDSGASTGGGPRDAKAGGCGGCTGAGPAGWDGLLVAMVLAGLGRRPCARTRQRAGA